MLQWIQIYGTWFLQVYSHGLVGEVGALITTKDSTSYTAFFIPNSSPKQRRLSRLLWLRSDLLELAHMTFRIIFARGFSVHNGIQYLCCGFFCIYTSFSTSIQNTVV